MLTAISLSFFFFLYFQFLLLCTLWKIKNVCFSKSLQFCWRSLPFVTEFLSTLNNKRKEESLCFCLCVCVVLKLTVVLSKVCKSWTGVCQHNFWVPVRTGFILSSPLWGWWDIFGHLMLQWEVPSAGFQILQTQLTLPICVDPYPLENLSQQDLYSQRVHSTCSAWMQPFGWIQQPQHPQLTHSLGGWKELQPPDPGHIQRQGGCPEQGLLLLSPFQKEETFV